MHPQNQGMAIRKPEKFIRKSDSRLAIWAFLVAGACAFPILDPFIGADWLNTHFYGLLPLPLAAVMLVLPGFLLWAISINQQLKFNEFLKEQQRRERGKLTGKILFRSQYRPHSEGASMEIVNTNQFDWTDAHVLIERALDGKKTCEKHYVGQVNQRQTVRLESRLQDRDGVKWRILVLTKEGCTTEFPDKWREAPYQKELLGPKKAKSEEGNEAQPKEEETAKTEALTAA